MSEFVVIWDNPFGVERKEREWFETRAEAEAAIAAWKVKFPWNTYWLAEVVAVHVGEGERPSPTGSRVATGERVIYQQPEGEAITLRTGESFPITIPNK